MKKYLLIIALIAAVFFPAFARVRTFRQEVGRFDHLYIYDNVNVVYHAGKDTTGIVEYKVNSTDTDAFIISNNNGHLKIQVATENVTDTLPVIHLYSDRLFSVETSSEEVVKIQSNSAVPKFSARLIGNGELVVNNIKASEVETSLTTGNGTIVISGVCEKAVCKMLGTGTIQCDELKAQEVNCKIMGGGAIGCWPMTKLDIRGIGSTKIYYKGKPKIKKVGGGKVLPLASE